MNHVVTIVHRWGSDARNAETSQVGGMSLGGFVMLLDYVDAVNGRLGVRVSVFSLRVCLACYTRACVCMCCVCVLVSVLVQCLLEYDQTHLLNTCIYAYLFAIVKIIPHIYIIAPTNTNQYPQVVQAAAAKHFIENTLPSIPKSNTNSMGPVSTISISNVCNVDNSPEPPL